MAFFIGVNMLVKLRRIIYDSKLIHKYEPDFIDQSIEMSIPTYSYESFGLKLSANLSGYNYCYIPDIDRYFYIDIRTVHNDLIDVTLTCDYGRTFAPEIASDFYLIDSDLEGTVKAHLPEGSHVLNEGDIAYLPDSEEHQGRYLMRSDVNHILDLFKSGIQINFEDYEPEAPEAPEAINPD